MGSQTYDFSFCARCNENSKNVFFGFSKQIVLVRESRVCLYAIEQRSARCNENSQNRLLSVMNLTLPRRLLICFIIYPFYIYVNCYLVTTLWNTFLPFLIMIPSSVTISAVTTPETSLYFSPFMLRPPS